jgi:hypothetical protein
MSHLVLSAYMRLIYFDAHLAGGNFAALHELVRRYPLSASRPKQDDVKRICSAVDMACIWYWKEVLCLHRSAATTCLLRRRGIPAQMVVGVQQLPFNAHAWVEVAGVVVNDRPYTSEIYSELDRC